jgi:hypothetical protein
MRFITITLIVHAPDPVEDDAIKTGTVPARAIAAVG